MTRRTYLITRDVTAYGVLPAITTACVAVWVGVALSGCSTLKGQDTARHVDNSRGAFVATTQSAETTHVTRTAATQSSGGESYTSDGTTSVTVTPGKVHVETTGHKSGTTQPTVVNVVNDDTDTSGTLSTKTNATTRNAVTDDSAFGPYFNGFGDAFAVDSKGNLSAKAVESTLHKRWPIAAGLVLFGLFYIFAPVRLGGRPVLGVGLMIGAALTLVLSDLWFDVDLFAMLLIIFWPYVSKSALFSRFTAVLDDWKTDMAPAEKAAFNTSLETAAGSQAQHVDQVRVEMKHLDDPKLVAAPVTL